MKVGPKVPGPTGPPEVDGPGAGVAVGETGKPEATRRFAEALGAEGAEAATPTEASATADPVAAILSRYGAGELTRSETVRGVAETVVGAWPAGLGDPAMRARTVEQLVEQLESDPTFTTLLDAATGSPR
ncbi:MAG: hypothetical protein JXB32_19560 [Deltaproteobacteria bacterium]|nr:hypothetical protein [Deltaproteobacteria bacterium]